VLKMLPLVEEAREALFEPGEEKPSQTAIAEWLTGRVPTVGGAHKWNASQISRLYLGPKRWIDHLEKEYEIAFRVREYVQNNPHYPDRDVVLRELEDIERVREEEIRAARRLGAQLTGEPFVERPLPPAPFLNEVSVTGRDRHVDQQIAEREERLRQREVRLAEENNKLRERREQLRERLRVFEAYDLGPPPQNNPRQRKEAELHAKELDLRRRELASYLQRQRLRWKEKEVSRKEQELARRSAPFREAVRSSRRCPRKPTP